MVATVAYELATIKDDFQANTFGSFDQLAPDVLGLANGGYVVAYNNADLGAGFIVLNFYNPNGASAIFKLLYIDPTEAIGAPSLAQLSNGNVVVVWDENQPGEQGLKGAIFTDTGDLAVPEFSFSNVFVDVVPQVTALAGADAGFVAAFASSGGNVLVEILDENGNTVAGPFQAQTTHVGNSEPVVTALADGGFVVTWTHDNGSDFELRARIFEADSTPRIVNGSTDDFVVASIGDNTQPAIAALPNGNWAIAYTDTGWGDEDVGITLAIYGSDGEVVKTSCT